MTFDPSTDYEIWDGIEDVTLGSRSISGDTPASTPTSVASAFRESLTLSQLQSFGSGASSEEMLAWHLATAELGGVVPKRLDTITDAAGVVWMVLDATYDTLIKNWRLTCKRQRS